MNHRSGALLLAKSGSDCFEKTANKRVKQAKSAFSEVKYT